MKHDTHTPTGFNAIGAFAARNLAAFFAMLAVMALAVMTAPQAAAQATVRSQADGLFNDGANWEGGTQPGPGVGSDLVAIGSGNTLTLNGGTVISLDQNFHVGVNGSGTFTLNGGTLITNAVSGAANENNSIGSGAGNLGRIDITGGLLEFGGDETRLGIAGGTGVINLTGGILFINADDANGTWEIGGSDWDASETTGQSNGQLKDVGSLGAVSITNAIASTNATTDIMIGVSINATGSVNVGTGGVLTTATGAGNAGGDDIFVGGTGHGHLVVEAGGRVDVGDDLFIGRWHSNYLPDGQLTYPDFPEAKVGSGHVQVNGGTLNDIEALLMVQEGSFAQGGSTSTLTITSGLVDVDESAEIGGDSNSFYNQSQAYVLMSGGQFDVGDNLFIGTESSLGVVSMNDGIINVGSDGANDRRLYIGYNSQPSTRQSIGSVTISGGTISLENGGDDDDVFLGYIGGYGYLEVNGDGHIGIGDDLEIGEIEGDRLSEGGGYRSTGVLQVDDNGSVYVFDNLNVGSGDFAAGTVDIDGNGFVEVGRTNANGFFSGQVDVAVGNESQGVILMNGGSLFVGAGPGTPGLVSTGMDLRVAVGNDAEGVISMNGGFVAVDNQLQIGVGTSSHGFVFVGEGAKIHFDGATDNDIRLGNGNGSTGGLAIDGGTVADFEIMYLGDRESNNEALTATGSVNMTGGLLAGGEIQVGAVGHRNSAQGEGFWSQTGGTVLIQERLYVGVNGGKGLMSLNGGLIVQGRDSNFAGGEGGTNDRLTLGNNTFDGDFLPNPTPGFTNNLSGGVADNGQVSGGTLVVSGGTFLHQADADVVVGARGTGLLIVEGGLFTTNVGRNDDTGNLGLNEDIIIGESSDRLGTGNGHILVRGTGVIDSFQTDIEMLVGTSELTVEDSGFLNVQTIRQSSAIIYGTTDIFTGSLTSTREGDNAESTINFTGGTIVTVNDIEERIQNDGVVSNMENHNANFNFDNARLTVGGDDLYTGKLTIGATTDAHVQINDSAIADGHIDSNRVTAQSLILGKGTNDASLDVVGGNTLQIEDGNISAGGSGLSSLTVGLNGSGLLITKGIGAYGDTSSEITNFTLGNTGTLQVGITANGANAIEANSIVIGDAVISIDTANIGAQRTIEQGAVRTANGVWTHGDGTGWINGRDSAGQELVAAGGTIILAQAGAGIATFNGASPITLGGADAASFSLSTANGVGGHLGVVANSALTGGPVVAVLRGSAVTFNNTLALASNGGTALKGTGANGEVDAAGLIVESDASLHVASGGTLHVGVGASNGNGGNATENASVHQEGNVHVEGDVRFGEFGSLGDVAAYGGAYRLAGGTLQVDGAITENVDSNQTDENAFFFLDGGVLDVTGNISLNGMMIGTRFGDNGLLTLNTGQSLNVNGNSNNDSARLTIGNGGTGGLVLDDSTSNLNVNFAGSGNANGGIHIGGGTDGVGSLVVEAGQVFVGGGGIRVADDARSTGVMVIGKQGGALGDTLIDIQDGDFAVGDSNNSNAVVTQHSGIVSVNDDRLVLSNGSANVRMQAYYQMMGGLLAIDNAGVTVVDDRNDILFEEGDIRFNQTGGTVIVARNIQGHNDVGTSTFSDLEGEYNLSAGYVSVGNDVVYRNGQMDYNISGGTFLIGNDLLGSNNTNAAHVANRSTFNVSGSALASIGNNLNISRGGEMIVDVSGASTFGIGGDLQLADPTAAGNTSIFRLTGGATGAQVGGIVSQNTADSDLVFRFDQTLNGLSKLTVNGGTSSVLGNDLIVDDFFTFAGAVNANVGLGAVWGGGVGTWAEPADATGWELFNPGTATLASGASYVLVETTGGTIDTTGQTFTDNSTGAGGIVVDHGASTSTITYTTTATLNRGLTVADLVGGVIIRESDLLIAQDSFAQAAANGTDASRIHVSEGAVLSLTAGNDLNVGASTTGQIYVEDGLISVASGNILLGGASGQGDLFIGTTGAGRVVIDDGDLNFGTGVNNNDVDILRGSLEIGGDINFNTSAITSLIDVGNTNETIEESDRNGVAGVYPDPGLTTGTLLVDGDVNFAASGGGTQRIYAQQGSVTSIGGNILMNGSTRSSKAIYIDAQDFTVAGGTIEAGLFRMGDSQTLAGEAGGFYHVAAGGALLVDQGSAFHDDSTFIIGNNGKGVLSVSGGRVEVGDQTGGVISDLRVGNNRNKSDGSALLISGGVVEVEHQVIIGNASDAFLELSGGTIKTAREFYIGLAASSSTTVDMTGGLLQQGRDADYSTHTFGGNASENSSIRIADDGYALFNMSGGTVHASGTLSDIYIGTNAGFAQGDGDDGKDTQDSGFRNSLGVLQMSGGLMTAREVLSVGLSGEGIITQSGGTIAAYQVRIGDAAIQGLFDNNNEEFNRLGIGSWTMTAGLAGNPVGSTFVDFDGGNNVRTQQFIVGDSGEGYFRQTGGTVAYRGFRVGDNSWATGTAVLEGGLVSTNEYVENGVSVYIGQAATGHSHLIVDGGTLISNERTYLASQESTRATIDVMDGYFYTDDTLFIGQQGHAVLNLTGGTFGWGTDTAYTGYGDSNLGGNNLAGEGSDADASGTINVLNGGLGTGTGAMIIGQSAAGHLIINGGTWAQGADLNVAAGDKGTGETPQSMGQVDVIAGLLYLDDDFNFGGGANSVSSFNQSGGTILVGADGENNGADANINFIAGYSSGTATSNMVMTDGVFESRGDWRIGAAGVTNFDFQGGLIMTGTQDGTNGLGGGGFWEVGFGGGANGVGNFTQSGGTFYQFDESPVYIGRGTKQSTVTINGGLFQLVNGNTTIVGETDNDNGLLIVDGGTYNGLSTLNSGASIVIGQLAGTAANAGASGIISVNSGLLQASNLQIGSSRLSTSATIETGGNSMGVVSITGGTTNLLDDIIVGNYDDSTGSLNISGGLVMVGNGGNDDFVVAAQGSRLESESITSGAFVIQAGSDIADPDGKGATGVVNITGGTTIVRSNWTLGTNEEFTAAGNFDNLTQTSLNTHNTAAQAPRALVTMTGGLVRLGTNGGVADNQGVLNVGRDSLAVGTRHSMSTFNMAGGTLELEKIQLNSDSTNTFNFTSGVIRANQVATGGNDNIVLELNDADQANPKLTIAGGTMDLRTDAGGQGNIGDTNNTINVIEITGSALLNALDIDANIEQSGGLVHFSENDTAAVHTRLKDTVNNTGVTGGGTALHDFTTTGGTVRMDIASAGEVIDFNTLFTNGGTAISGDQTDTIANDDSDTILADAIDFTGATINVDFANAGTLTTGMHWDLVDWNTFSSDAANANTGSFAGSVNSYLDSGSFTFDFINTTFASGAFIAFNLWDTDGVLYILPEPSRVLLQVIGLGYFLLRRRRKGLIG